jgi:hypothetical protein
MSTKRGGVHHAIAALVGVVILVYIGLLLQELH